jgi:hypothetical protein
MCGVVRQTALMEDTEPSALRAGSTLRFRIEDHTRGIESSTWSIVGSKKSGDLYFSGREIMGDLKLSLHESGITRMAWTAAASASRVAPGADRVLSRWTAVDPLPNGWALVLRVSIPDSALSPILPPWLNGHANRRSHFLPPALGVPSRFESFLANREAGAFA